MDLDLRWSVPEAQAALAPFRAAGVRIVAADCRRNLIAVDGQVRGAAIRDVCRAMELAGAIGVPAVVCGGGHRDPEHSAERAWVHPDTWSEAALDVLIDSCWQIVGSVSPSAASLRLEPWVITSLNSPRRLATLVRRVDHPQLAIELDPVNLMTLEYYADTARLLNQCFDLLGPKIRSVHAKDTMLTPRPLTFHLGEAVPGDGVLDYPALLRRMQDLPDDTPLLIEHLPDEATIVRARDYILCVAARQGYAVV